MCYATPLVRSAAKDVKLSDVLPEGFELAAGSLQTTFPSIDEGADVTHSFVVVPKEVSGPPA